MIRLCLQLAGNDTFLNRAYVQTQVTSYAIVLVENRLSLLLIPVNCLMSCIVA